MSRSPAPWRAREGGTTPPLAPPVGSRAQQRIPEGILCKPFWSVLRALDALPGVHSTSPLVRNFSFPSPREALERMPFLGSTYWCLCMRFERMLMLPAVPAGFRPALASGMRSFKIQFEKTWMMFCSVMISVRRFDVVMRWMPQSYRNARYMFLRSPRSFLFSFLGVTGGEMLIVCKLAFLALLLRWASLRVFHQSTLRGMSRPREAPYRFLRSPRSFLFRCRFLRSW